jgi:hypothetical protein
MNGTQDNHLSTEKLEDAARGRLSPVDMESVRSHCATCKSCRKALDEELRIAQGTRAWARSAMKQRLAEQVAHIPQNRIPWPRVMAAAALILVVVGVGILYQWLQTGKEAVPVFTDNVQPQTESLARKDRQPSAPAPDEQELSGHLAAEPKADATRTRKESAAPPGSGRSSVLRPAQISEEPAAAPFAAVQQADAGDAIHAVGTSEGLILWGTRLPAPLTEKKKVEETRATEVMQDKATYGNMVRSSKTAGGTGVRSHTFIIDQRVPLAFLDQKYGHPGATAAKVMRSGDTLHVTLFLDSLLTPTGIRSAFAREIPPDSFEVILPDGTTFGYRTPSGLLR